MYPMIRNKKMQKSFDGFWPKFVKKRDCNIILKYNGCNVVVLHGKKQYLQNVFVIQAN